MKKLFMCFGTAFLLFASANAQDSILLRTEKAWYNDSFEDTGVYGVNTEKAWQFLKEHNRKASPLVVGILDGGVQADHIDLAENMWVNPKEKPGNGKDDDNNGYIDDVNGWNFIGGKDGKDVDGDNLESVRVYKGYLPLFESSDAAKNKENETKFSEKYEDYLKLKSKIAKKQAEARSNVAQYTALKDQVDKGFQPLIEFFGDEPINEDNLSKYQPTEESMMALMMFGMTPKEEWEGRTMKQIHQEISEQLGEGIEYFQSQLDYHYNPDFESRGIVGDDYSNKTESKYGNNDVEGPDALHGTHVAGLVSAVRGNGKGIDGIAGNSVKLMGVRTVPNGDERDKDVANSIRYAVDNGAKILNMSFGKDYSPDKKVVWDAMRYAEKKGALLVKAAGNDNLDIDTDIHYPTNFDDNGNKIIESVITVGASNPDPNALKASFSNYGKKSVDVFAPGNQILSTVPHDKFKELQGTSMASPITAGVAALVWSHYPKLTAVEVKQIIMNSVNKNDQLKDISVSGGVIDAYKAVQLAEEMYKNK